VTVGVRQMAIRDEHGDLAERRLDPDATVGVAQSSDLRAWRHRIVRDMIAYRLQAERLGDLDRDTRRLLDLIPLRYARRIVMNVEHEARLVGEFLQFYLHSRTRVPFEPPPSA
jgi:hypothetical protein